MAEARQEFPIEQQLRKDIQDAQRARDQQKLDTLRMALGAIHNLEVARTDRKNQEDQYDNPEALKCLGYSPIQVTNILAYIEEHDTIEGAPQGSRLCSRERQSPARTKAHRSCFRQTRWGERHSLGQNDATSHLANSLCLRIGEWRKSSREDYQVTTHAT